MINVDTILNVANIFLNYHGQINFVGSLNEVGPVLIQFCSYKYENP